MLSLHFQIVLTEPILDQTENRTSATKEGTAVAVATVRELPDIPMPKEVRKEWTCEICQLTVLSEKTLNLHLQGKKHKTTEALKAKNQPNIVPASTTKKTEQPIEEPQKTVSTKEWKHRTTTNNEGEQHAYSMSVSASTAKIFDQPSKEEHEKRVSMSNSALEQKNEAVSEEYYRCNLCNTNCTGENDLASHYNGRKHKARIQLHNKLVGIGQVWPIFLVHFTLRGTVVLVAVNMNMKMFGWKLLCFFYSWILADCIQWSW